MFLLSGISFILSSIREGQQDEFRRKNILLSYFLNNLSITIQIYVSLKKGKTQMMIPARLSSASFYLRRII